ncbi:MAG: hypothetical protein OXD32_00095 [Endozoicomonadaceae bacterium]|nr:hypothetical protein [Endozoicomonadaceae bacterium]
MKTFFVILQLSLFLCYVINSRSHKKEHHNKVYFTGAAHSVSFKMYERCITPKQPFHSSLWIKTIKKTGLDIMAGRHGSGAKSGDTIDCTYKYMARNFNLSSFFLSSFTYKKLPRKLNFSVEGALFVNGLEFDDIVLAQGHHGAINDWWFGGNYCFVADDVTNAVNCTSTTGENWCFIRGKSSEISKLPHTSPNKIKVVTHPCSYYYYM